MCILKINEKKIGQFLIPLKNGCLTHVDPKLYTKCPF